MSYKPMLEFLEERACPTVDYHGGPVISHVNVQPVYYGNGWLDTYEHRLEALQVQYSLQDMVNSPYMDMLNCYSIGRGTVLPGAIVNGPLSRPNVLDDSLIQSQLDSFPADPNTLFVIFTAPGTASTFGRFNSETDYLGYHYFADRSADPYAVVAYPGTPNYVWRGLTPVQQMTDVASHEISEAITDPYLTGWYKQDVHGNYAGEIGDLVQALRFMYHGYLVQAEAGPLELPLYPSDYIVRA